MSELEAFREFIRGVRAGNEEAAAELVRKYEPLIRREVRLNLEDQRLRRTFDSLDITQSALASFFLRAAMGEYDLEHPQQLVALLMRIARNKLASAARREYQDRRDLRRIDAGDNARLDQLAAEDSTPSMRLANEESLQALRQQLTPEERRIAELRAEGLSWQEIAGRMGGQAQARRMQLTRGIERAGKKLGITAL